MVSFRFDGDASLVQKIYDSFAMEPSSTALERLKSIDASSSELNRLLDKSDADVADCLEDIDKEFMTRFVYHSTAMEGSTLTLPETELAIEGEFLPSEEKQLQDLYSVKGSYEAYEFAIQAVSAGRRIDEDFVKDVHALAALDIQPRNRGSYRTTQVYITNSLTVPASNESIRPLMKDLFIAFNRSEQHPLLRFAGFHALFENIHPFRDGNGRCGRIVLNAMLVDEGYAPIAIKHESKSRYAESLQEWQVKGNPEPLLNMVCDCIEKETRSRKEAIESTLRLEPIARMERKERERFRNPYSQTNEIERVRGLVRQGYAPQHVDFGTTPREIKESINEFKRVR